MLGFYNQTLAWLYWSLILVCKWPVLIYFWLNIGDERNIHETRLDMFLFIEKLLDK